MTTADIGHELSLIAAGAPGAMHIDEGAIQQLVHEYRYTREEATAYMVRLAIKEREEQ